MATSVALYNGTDEVPLYATISYSNRHAASRASTVNAILFPAGKSLLLRIESEKYVKRRIKIAQLLRSFIKCVCKFVPTL
jgi:hypothetical protein